MGRVWGGGGVRMYVNKNLSFCEVFVKIFFFFFFFWGGGGGGSGRGG